MFDDSEDEMNGDSEDEMNEDSDEDVPILPFFSRRDEFSPISNIHQQGIAAMSASGRLGYTENENSKLREQQLRHANSQIRFEPIRSYVHHRSLWRLSVAIIVIYYYYKQPQQQPQAQLQRRRVRSRQNSTGQANFMSRSTIPAPPRTESAPFNFDFSNPSHNYFQPR
jgi:hypothetical protein